MQLGHLGRGATSCAEVCLILPMATKLPSIPVSSPKVAVAQAQKAMKTQQLAEPKAIQSQQPDAEPKAIQTQQQLAEEPKAIQTQQLAEEPKAIQIQQLAEEPKAIQTQQLDADPKAYAYNAVPACPPTIQVLSPPCWQLAIGNTDKIEGYNSRTRASEATYSVLRTTYISV